MKSKLRVLAAAVCLVSTSAIAQSGPPVVSAKVINTPSNPVPVTGVINVPDRKMPFLRSIPCDGSSGTNICTGSFTLESSYRVVLEFVGLQCDNGPSTRNATEYPIAMLASIKVGDVLFGLNLPVTGIVFNQARRYSFGQLVSINVPQGATLGVQFNVTDSSRVHCDVGLSGYQVSVP